MDKTVVFSGRIRQGSSEQEVRENFARMFKLTDPARLDSFFTGQPVVIKRGLSEEEARKYEQFLFKAGALCEIQTAPGAAPAPPPPPPPAPVSFESLSLTPIETAPEPTALTPPPSMSTSSTAVPPPPRPTAGRTTTARPSSVRNRQIPESSDNNSGTGGFIPSDAAGLSWGGFFLNWIWGLFNGSFFGLLVFVPIIGFIVPFYYLFKGREIAWQKKQWQSVEHFNKVQKNWGIAGLLVFLLSLWAIHNTVNRVHDTMAMMGADPAAASAARQAELDQITDPQKRAQMEKFYEALDLGKVAASPTPSPERDAAREKLISQAQSDQEKDALRQMYQNLDQMQNSMKH